MGNAAFALTVLLSSLLPTVHAAVEAAPSVTLAEFGLTLQPDATDPKPAAPIIPSLAAFELTRQPMALLQVVPTRLVQSEQCPERIQALISMLAETNMDGAVHGTSTNADGVLFRLVGLSGPRRDVIVATALVGFSGVELVAWQPTGDRGQFLATVTEMCGSISATRYKRERWVIFVLLGCGLLWLARLLYLLKRRQSGAPA